MGVGVLAAVAVPIIDGVLAAVTVKTTNMIHAKPRIVTVIINLAGVGGDIVIAGESIFPAVYIGTIGIWIIALLLHQW